VVFVRLQKQVFTKLSKISVRNRNLLYFILGLKFQQPAVTNSLGQFFIQKNFAFFWLEHPLTNTQQTKKTRFLQFFHYSKVGNRMDYFWSFFEDSFCISKHYNNNNNLEIFCVCVQVLDVQQCSQIYSFAPIKSCFTVKFHL
jgi:hypothetical protein